MDEEIKLKIFRLSGFRINFRIYRLKSYYTKLLRIVLNVSGRTEVGWRVNALLAILLGDIVTFQNIKVNYYLEHMGWIGHICPSWKGLKD